MSEFYKWFLDWYKSVKNEATIMISVPTEIRPVPTKDENAVILEVIKKSDENIVTIDYLYQIVLNADKCGVNIYFNPDDDYIEPKNERFYKLLGFAPTPDKKWMIRYAAN